MFSDFNIQVSHVAKVCTVKDGKIFLERQYSSASLEYNIPITSSTVFHIGSISKQFTGFAILLLVDEGKISVDDDIRLYLPEVSVERATLVT